MTPADLLVARGLTVRHGGLVALDAVDLTIAEGTIVGVIGANGAGKTTLLDALAGFVAAAGTITFADRPVGDLPPHQRARLGLVRTFQSVELFDDLTVRENVLVGLVAPTWRDRLLDAVRPDRTDPAAVDDLLAELDLAAVADRTPAHLSHGVRRTVGLARALARHPRLLLLDEPAAGLGPDETEALAAVVRGLPARGTTTVLVDHDMPFVMGLCDTIHVLDQGRALASGPPAAVAEDPAVVASYLGGPRPPPPRPSSRSAA